MNTAWLPFLTYLHTSVVSIYKQQLRYVVVAVV